MNKAVVWMCECVQNDMLSPVLESRFNKVAGIHLYQKETPAQVLSCDYCKILQNFYENLF